MSAQGSGSLANKILQQKTKDLLSPSARQTKDDSTLEYDGEEEGETMEDDSLASGKRKVSKKLHLICTRKTAIVKMNSQKRQHVDDFCDNNSVDLAKQVQDHGIQRKHQQQQVGSKSKGKKRAFCSPGSMSAYLEFRKRQKENNEVLDESNRSLHNSMTARIRYDNDALNANNDNDAIYENDDDDGLNENDDDDGLNENANAIDIDREGDQEFDQQDVAQYGMEENELSSKRKNHRGPTMLRKVHVRTTEECQVIVLNSLGQPVGPTKEIVQEFKFFLGTVARDSELAPLNYFNFPSLPTLDNIWNYVQEKYMVPDGGISWVMDAVNNCWRYHKCQIKKKHFYAYDNDALRWKNKPNTISNLQFRDLLLYWNTDEAKKISHNNKDNRLMLDDMHTLGRKSFSILRHELRQQDPDKQEPSQAKVYKESRKRSSGKTYKTSCEKAKDNIMLITATTLTTK
ncbi:uncharacterized protein LOC110728515 isoform X2 [Chenopodium quinoa]|uniref:uncharacterized protein LOC110728515 isoform X2 n=1 Tax=Chenopodium quinoa TaxID=63459 RepID=UPI000B77BBD3|nr:uncharacterized protein LOC110728515 isoform X2 [Chenopodium quinoa]